MMATLTDRDLISLVLPAAGCATYPLFAPDRRRMERLAQRGYLEPAMQMGTDETAEGWWKLAADGKALFLANGRFSARLQIMRPTGVWRPGQGSIRPMSASAAERVAAKTRT